MAPKRATKPFKPAPARRSTRLQQQEEEKELPLVMRRGAFAPLLTPAIRAVLREQIELDDDETVFDMAPERSFASSDSMRRELTMARLRERYSRRLSEEQAERESGEQEGKVRAVAAAQPQPEAEVVIPTPATAIMPPERPTSGWRQMLTSLGGYLTSPFIRKRSADEEEDDTLHLQPSQKRSRVEEPVTEQQLQTIAGEQPRATAPPPPSPPQAVEQPQKRPAEEDTSEQQQQKRRRVEEPQHVQIVLDVGEDTPAPLHPAAQTTPQGNKRKSPHAFTGPSSKNPRMPTSLSTITEYTEPSFFSNLSESLLEGTPSRPPRDQPQRALLQVPQSTPNGMSQKTPSTMRRSAQLRAARKAGLGTPSGGLGIRAATPKPKEPNADARQAKLERIRMLQKELEELEEDDDVKEFQANRRKRVKIDNLVSIPHNLPGDPSGMFRVPEGDSDDEMEVYDDVEERSNVFEELHSMEEQQQKTRASLMRQQESASTIPQQANASTMQQQVKASLAPQPVATAAAGEHALGSQEELKFEFPSVGRMPDDYYVSEEFKEAACNIFEGGLKEFLANYDTVGVA